MDQRVAKLAHFGIEPKEAQALIDEGYDTPRKIKANRTKAKKVAKLGRLEKKQK